MLSVSMVNDVMLNAVAPLSGQLISMSFMLSVTNKPFMLSVTMLNVVMLSAVMLNVVAPLSGQFLIILLEKIFEKRSQFGTRLAIWGTIKSSISKTHFLTCYAV
jgi:hypothetical protein